jgi:hypothetical protein
MVENNEFDALSSSICGTYRPWISRQHLFRELVRPEQLATIRGVPFNKKLVYFAVLEIHAAYLVKVEHQVQLAYTFECPIQCLNKYLSSICSE